MKIPAQCQGSNSIFTRVPRSGIGRRSVSVVKRERGCCVSSRRVTLSQWRVRVRKKEEDADSSNASWFVTEKLSNFIGRMRDITSFDTISSDSINDSGVKISGMQGGMLRAEAIEALRRDVFDNKYFITGVFTSPSLYSENCVFSDDFASFTGFTRFRQNLSALSLLTRDYSVRVISFDVDENENASGDVVASTRALVRLELRLPWRPELKWVWKVRHVLASVLSEDDIKDKHEREDVSSNLETNGKEAKDVAVAENCNKIHVVAHEESWEIDKDKGVALLFKPGPDAQWPFA